MQDVVATTGWDNEEYKTRTRLRRSIRAGRIWFTRHMKLGVAGMASRIPRSLESPVRRNPGLEARGIEGLNRKPAMSCRIDQVVSAENLVVLFISGQIRGEHVDMLRGILEQESGGFAIDLKNVLLVDREAVKLLALSEANGTELRNCPPYIREWVARERAQTNTDTSE
jgi:hypothetical protein